MKQSLSAEPPQRRTIIAVAVALEPDARPDVSDTLKARDFVVDVLETSGWAVEKVDISPRDLKSRKKTERLLRSIGTGCVFNLFEGFGDDSGAEHRFRAAVEDMGLPCTGNPAEALKLCLSKENCSLRLREKGIPVPEGMSFHRGFNPALLDGLALPVFLKPLFEDGSVGIDTQSLVAGRDELFEALEVKIARFPAGVRVESFLPGREFSVACMGNDPYDVLGVSVIDYGDSPRYPPFLDYGSKWDSTSPLYTLIPKRAEGFGKKRAEELARASGKALGCRGYFRVDLREKDGELYVLDVNPNPDMTPDGGFLRQCRESGFTPETAVVQIVELALHPSKEGRPA